jgi:hypothetical protein
MNKLNQYRLLAVIVPILCLAVGGWVVWNQMKRLGEISAQRAEVEKNLEFQKKMIADIGSQPLAEKEPTVPASDAEQAAFLEGLRTIAKNADVTLTRWSNVPAPTGDQSKQGVQLPKDVAAILSTLEVNGQYSNVREFLYSIARAPRLLNFSGIRWSRASDNASTVLTVTVTRYVSTGVAPAAPPFKSTSVSNGTAEQSS